MTASNSVLVRILTLFVVVVSILSAWAWTPVSADVVTPVPDAVTPQPTVVATLPAPEATTLPTVIQEKASPVATVAAFPSVAAETSPTAAIEQRPLPTAPVTVPTQNPIVVPAATPADTGPTPDQLRQNARLRWGKHVPASVRRWAFLIVRAARRYHLDPNMIAAVMTMESNGDPTAWSGADARGLMQILHGPWNPRENVFEGARMLADLYAQFGDWTLVFAGYNAGAGAVTAYGGVPPYRETRDYVVVVQYLWDLFSHHILTLKRKVLYRQTLRDLQHFANQRKKVHKLASIGQVPVDVPSVCSGSTCSVSPGAPSDQTLDPFWPVGGVPDPLQQVAPISSSP